MSLEERIRALCCFVCSDFGSYSRTFQLNIDTIRLLLKLETLDSKTKAAISTEMLNHGYLCIITESAVFIHFSLINSIGFIDEEFVNTFFDLDDEEESEDESSEEEVVNKHLH